MTYIRVEFGDKCKSQVKINKKKKKKWLPAVPAKHPNDYARAFSCPTIDDLIGILVQSNFSLITTH
jgi:hypothetical protein